MASRPQLVLGTANRKKAEELIRLLDAVGLEITTLADFPEAISVAEEGDTFAANAAAKAIGQARHLGRWVLAEDSGLAVDALDGAPGVFSARYSGPQATDESNNQKLLEALRDVGPQQRTAGYVCHATLSDPSGEIRAEIEAYCRGRILTEARGTHGFGYDPLFEVVEYHRSFGQLGPAVKGCLSHRGRAVRRLIPQLAALVDTGRWT
ncbi:MAG: non-canonical purine NTP pyrophosphatase [Planctomycetes bacterium]|nr:non-canonical purine NTP pyrophosphatase [Planctomycetota bacterium]